MLSDEVVTAVQEGRFHIWSVETIDEGIEILTGMPAGERNEDGTWPENTLNGLVDRRLREMLKQMKKFGGGDKEGGRKEKE